VIKVTGAVSLGFLGSSSLLRDSCKKRHSRMRRA
jgi:hypothetical protein